MALDRTINAKDLEILAIIQGEARISNAEMARQVGMAPSAVLERLRKLEARGVVRGYEARLDPHALGLGLLAFVFVRVEEHVGSVRAGALLAEIPEVQEVHHVAGEDCYLVKVRCADPEDLGRVLRDRVGGIGEVRSTRSTIVLTTVKESAILPLPAAERAASTEAEVVHAAEVAAGA